MTEPDNFAGSFKDQRRVDSYVEQGPRVFLPGYEALHAIMRQLLSEKLGDTASVLCLGAGGGAEIETLRTAHPAWRFLCVDPSEEMNQAAARRLGPDLTGVEIQTGLIFDAPAGPFDGATFMLVLHFIPDDGSKLATLKALRDRLKPGAPLFLAHQCVDKTGPDAELWFDRQMAFALANGLDPEYGRMQRQRFTTTLNSVSQARDEALLREAGFSGIELVFAGLAWRGWLASA